MSPGPTLAAGALLLLATTFGLSACSDPESGTVRSSTAAPCPPVTTTIPAPGSPTTTLPKPTKPEVVIPDSAPPKELQVKDISEGTGAEAQRCSNLVMAYTGVAYSTKKEFDSSYKSGRPLSFRLGTGQVIDGWDRGLVGMKVGGRRELTIPPELAYGADGTPDGSIKPNETLVFVVDLLAIR